jgi:hypothetical protein
MVLDSFLSVLKKGELQMLKKVPTYMDCDGNVRVDAWLQGKKRSVRVDEVVLETFVGPPPRKGMVPIHLDGDPKNCAVVNLKWGK